MPEIYKVGLFFFASEALRALEQKKTETTRLFVTIHLHLCLSANGNMPHLVRHAFDPTIAKLHCTSFRVVSHGKGSGEVDLKTTRKHSCYSFTYVIPLV